MARPINKLNVKQVASLKTEGRHADGGGLYLRVSKAGTRSWVFMHVEGERRSEIGLGSAQGVSLAAARRIAGEMREAVAIGGNPRQVLTPVAPAEVAAIPTFGEFAEEYISSVEAGWRNPVHRQQWRSSLRDDAHSMRDLPIEAIGTDGVLAVLKPIWLGKSETAKRVRGRIEKILDARKARGYRPTGNLRAIQILLGHTKIENTVRYFGVDIEDALVLAKRTEI